MALQDLDKDDDIPEPYKKGSAKEVFALQKKDQEAKKRSQKSKLAKLHQVGFEGENTGEVLF